MSSAFSSLTTSTNSNAVWRVSLGIGKLSAEMLLVHGALTDHHLKGSDRDHGEG